MIKIEKGVFHAEGPWNEVRSEIDALFQAAEYSDDVLSALVLAMNEYQEKLTNKFVEQLKSHPSDLLSRLEEESEEYVS